MRTKAQIRAWLEEKYNGLDNMDPSKAVIIELLLDIRDK